MRIAVYFNTTKAAARSYHPQEEKPASLRLLEYCALGIQETHNQYISVYDDQLVNADLAIIFGYGRPRDPDAPPVGSFQKFRYEIIEHQRQKGGHTLCLDSGLFLGYDQKQYWRAGLGSPLNTGDFFEGNYGAQRSEQFTRDTGIYMKPYRQEGEYIILTLQPLMNWSMAGRDPIKWANNKIREIREYTDMPIHVRNHPGDPDALNHIDLIGETRTYKNGKSPLVEHVKKAHALITFNTTACTDALAEGVPVFADHHESHAWDIANKDISKINEPYLYDRTDWFNKICYRLWRFDEMRNGYLINRVVNYLEDRNG